MGDKQQHFAPERTYTIGRLALGQESGATNPQFMKRPAPSSLKGSQLITAYNTRTTQEFWDKNPIGLDAQKEFHIYETSDSGDKTYFDSGMILPKPEDVVAPATDVPVEIDAPSPASSSGLADGAAAPPIGPPLYTTTPAPRPPSQSSVYQPAMEALMEQIREERKLSMTLIEENKAIREQMLAEAREYRAQVAALMQQNAVGLSDAKDASEVAGIHASEAKVLGMRMDMLVEQNKREHEWSEERAKMKEEMLRKELEQPPSTTLGDITSVAESLAPLAPVLMELVKGLFGGGGAAPSPQLGPGYPGPVPLPPQPAAAMPPVPPPTEPQAVAPTPRAVAPIRIPSGRNGAIPNSGNSNADMAELETF